MKILIFLVLLFFFGTQGLCQSRDRVDSKQENVVYKIEKAAKPEVLTNGFIDLMNSGQMNASARLFKLFIGEPGKFVLPVSLYTGVSANNFNNTITNNEPLVLNLINPMSGVFNISIDGAHYFLKGSKGLSSLGFQYQAGQRLLSFTEQTFQTITFMNSYSNAGLIFQTGAWEKNKTENMGMFWVSPRFLIASANKYIKTFIGFDYPQEFVWGYSIGLGIEINRVLNIKGYYYRYLGIDNTAFGIPIFHFSFNYSMRY